MQRTSDNTEVKALRGGGLGGSPWELTTSDSVSTQHSRQRRPKAKTWWGERKPGAAYAKEGTGLLERHLNG